jgi:nitrogen fixation protein FixH
MFAGLPLFFGRLIAIPSITLMTIARSHFSGINAKRDVSAAQ